MLYSYWITTHLLKLYRKISSIELRYSAKCVCGREREGGIQRDRERERQERDRDKKTVNAERRVQNNK